MPDELLPPFTCNLCKNQFPSLAVKQVKQYNPAPTNAFTEIDNFQQIQRVALINKTTGAATYLVNGYNCIGRKAADGRAKVSVALSVEIGNDNYISRNHCYIKVKETKAGNSQTIDAVLLDNGSPDIGSLESRNGTFLNGNRLHVKDIIYLKNGDTITFGEKSQTTLVVEMS